MAEPDAAEGGELLDPHHLRGDLKMIAAAIRKGWDIPQHLRERLPEAIGEIALNEGKDKNGKRIRKRHKAREQIGAARVLVQMDRSNGQHERPSSSEREDRAIQTVNVQVNNSSESPAPIKIVHVDNWYGSPANTAAEDLPAAKPAAPAAGPAEPGTV